MDEIALRAAEPEDLEQLASMCHALWPETTVDEHAREVLPLLKGAMQSNLPTVFFVAEHTGAELIGFVQVGLRSHAEGCNPWQPVGYVEAWYVAPAFRRRRIGARLITAAEEWARSQRCVEMASDTWPDNLESQMAHKALGFEEVERSVNYRKRL
ncbi:MAG: GNAT family N-acetyltransferase [Acidobacteriaceae bacterium]|nr:GNAT family N-acetyltransferase [Acidobacteriaceae bacterium]